MISKNNEFQTFVQKIIAEITESWRHEDERMSIIVSSCSVHFWNVLTDSSLNDCAGVSPDSSDPNRLT